MASMIDVLPPRWRAAAAAAAAAADLLPATAVALPFDPPHREVLDLRPVPVVRTSTRGGGGRSPGL
jgi:hypothetical protein